MRILFSGMLAGVPGHGGATWAVLQYVLGLQRLGYEVVLAEPVTELTTPNRAYFDEVTVAFGLERCAALLVEATGETAGLAYETLRKAARHADLLVNVNGMLRDPVLTESIPIRLYLDLDPVFNQLWAEQGIDVGLDGHTHFATVGLGLARPGATLPTAGRSWIATPQPVVLTEWPVAQETRWEGLTTVGNWRSYGALEQDGVRYGQKAHSLRRFFEVPQRTDVPVYGALAIHTDERDDLASLGANGWKLLDPTEVAGTPNRYRRFVQGSWAELGIAKEGYVVSGSGWFSDRSVCYLASGRPVLGQETGFSDFLPTGEGLLAFATIEELLGGIEELRAEYSRHRRAARALAEDVFGSDKVLARLLDAIGAG